MLMKNELTITTWERKILRRIYVSKKENEVLGITSNYVRYLATHKLMVCLKVQYQVRICLAERHYY